MADCRRRNCKHAGELIDAALMQLQGFRDFIMPQRHWCQEVAMVGFYIDSLRTHSDASSVVGDASEGTPRDDSSEED